MHKKRLLKLADLVEQSVEKSRGRKGFRFTMCDWGHAEHNVAPSLDCGTSACMMGVAAISGKFKRAGLRYTVISNGPYGADLAVHLNSDVPCRYTSAIPAAEALFGISREEAHFLFLPGMYGEDAPLTGKRGARYAAKRVRKFVEHGGIF
jgi:hypothetical protein